MNSGKEANHWNWSKTHPDTKFLTQRVISMEGQTMAAETASKRARGVFPHELQDWDCKGKRGHLC